MKLLAALVLTLGTAAVAPALARTYSFPYIVEGSGTAGSAGFSFDTSIVFTNVNGLGGIPDGGTATAQIYLFDRATGGPAMSASNQHVCNPCGLPIGIPRRSEFRLQDAYIAAGGFVAGVVLPHAVVVVSGTGSDQVRVSAEIANATFEADPGDTNGDAEVSVADVFYLINHLFAFGPGPFLNPFFHNAELTPGEVPAQSGTYVIHRIHEQAGTTASTRFTRDVHIVMTNTGGLAGAPLSGAAEVALFLFDAAGQPMSGATGPLCGGSGCLYTLNDRAHVAVRVDDLIMAAGGYGATPAREGFAVIRVTGTGAGSVAVAALELSTRRRSAPDVFFKELRPQPIQVDN